MTGKFIRNLSLQSVFKGSLTLFLFIWLFSGTGCDKQNTCVSGDEDCPIGMHCKLQTGECVSDCQEDKDCKKNESCDTTRGRCKAKATPCKAKTEKRCDGSQLYWYDSCGFRGELAEDCGNAGCADGKCRPQESCGDGTCEPGKEDCLSCPNDCACAGDEVCENGTCKKADLCGNGTCDTSKQENCENCPTDCGCPKGQLCSGGTCTPHPSCGNGQCEQDKQENCRSCPKDCPCPSGKSCNANAVCVDACGDNRCERKLGENCSVCPQDCACGTGLRCVQGRCERTCGNGRCESSYGENCSTCAKDCPCPQGQSCNNGLCGSDCGNGKCEADKGETCSTCAKDCACKPDESCDSGQCKPWCGNNICDKGRGENCSTCAQDCQCPSSHKCENGQCKPLCGDGNCANGENCTTCPIDCKCQKSETCINGQCKCIPNCTGKVCGSDGCGGFCGNCTGRTVCKNGQCECRHECKKGQSTCVGSGSYQRCEQDKDGCRYLKTHTCQSGQVCQNGSCCGSSCQGKECGPDGCGGSCGTCSSRASCKNGKCICHHQCSKLGPVCTGKTAYKECLKDASNCRYWSKTKRCGSGQTCTNNSCCTPICSGKECGSNGCGGVCGTCHYGCVGGLCKRQVLVISIKIDCKLCTDPVFYKKPDPYIKLTLSNGATYKSKVKGDTCNTVTYNWKIPGLEPLALKSAKFEVFDEDVDSDDHCVTWTGDFSKLGRFTITNPGKKNAQIKIEVKK